VWKFDYQPVPVASTIPFNRFSNRLLID